MSTETNINRSNYENFVLDYLDGCLVAEEMDCFEKFLIINPDIAEEIEGIQDTVLAPANDSYGTKDLLKKKPITGNGGINEGNYEEVFIASYEEDLTSKQRLNLDNFLTNNPQLQSEYNIYGNLKVDPNYKVTFSKKNELKRNQRISPYWYSSAAAVILIFTSLWFFNNQNEFIDKRTSLSINTIHTKSTNTFKNKNADILISIPTRYIVEIKQDYETVEEEVRLKMKLSKLAHRNYNDKLLYNDDIYILSPQTQQTEYLVGTHYQQKPKKKKNKTLFASVFNNQWNKVKSTIGSAKPKKGDSDDPTYVQVLDTGIKLFNTITGSNTYTSKSYNNNGELVGYQIEGKEVLLSRNTPSESVQ